MVGDGSLVVLCKSRAISTCTGSMTLRAFDIEMVMMIAIITGNTQSQHLFLRPNLHS